VTVTGFYFCTRRLAKGVSRCTPTLNLEFSNSNKKECELLVRFYNNTCYVPKPLSRATFRYGGLYKNRGKVYWNTFPRLSFSTGLFWHWPHVKSVGRWWCLELEWLRSQHVTTRVTKRVRMERLGELILGVHFVLAVLHPPYPTLHCDVSHFLTSAQARPELQDIFSCLRFHISCAAIFNLLMNLNNGTPQRVALHWCFSSLSTHTTHTCLHIHTRSPARAACHHTKYWAQAGAYDKNSRHDGQSWRHARSCQQVRFGNSILLLEDKYPIRAHRPL